jgi:hypothetical protein
MESFLRCGIAAVELGEAIFESPKFECRTADELTGEDCEVTPKPVYRVTATT